MQCKAFLSPAPLNVNLHFDICPFILELLFCQDDEAELVVMTICIFDKYITTRLLLICWSQYTLIY